jgi:hypothetical protein
VSWGLPRRRIDQVRQPATAATAPGSSAVVRARYVIVSGAGDGVFVYAGTPALGNPPIAWMGAGLVDPYGNVLPSTTGVEGGGTFQAGDTLITPKGMFQYSAAPGGGDLLASFSDSTTDPFGSATQPGVASYGSGATAGSVVTMFGNAVVFINSDGAETAIGAYGNQVQVNSVGADPSTLWLNLPAFAEIITALTPADTGAAETWHDLRPLGTGFSGTIAGFWPPQYRLNALGAVELLGSVTLAAAYNSVTWGTISADWCPAVESYIPVSVTSNAGAAPGNSQSAYMSISTAGALQFHGLPGGLPTGTAGAVIVFSGSYPLLSSPITS